MDKVKVSSRCMLCCHSHEEELELPGCPDYDCPECGEEGSLYIDCISKVRQKGGIIRCIILLQI